MFLYESSDSTSEDRFISLSSIQFQLVFEVLSLQIYWFLEKKLCWNRKLGWCYMLNIAFWNRYKNFVLRRQFSMAYRHSLN